MFRSQEVITKDNVIGRSVDAIVFIQVMDAAQRRLSEWTT